MLWRLLTAIPLLLGPAAFSADMGLLGGDLHSQIYTDIDGDVVWQMDTLTFVPQSPFTGATGTAAGGTSASGGYDFEFSALGGTFDIASAHTTVSTGTYSSGRHSYVYGALMLSPDVPVVVDLLGSITATMSMDESSAYVYFTIVRNNEADLYSIGNGGQGAGGTRTWNAAGQFVIQPGATYTVEYFLRLDCGQSVPAGIVEDATGQATITLSVVPEPGTMLALVLAALAFIGRSRRAT